MTDTAPVADGPLVSDASPVLGAHRWPSNAALIADVARLGYLDGTVLDVTYGRGLWWTEFRPARLIGLDADRRKARDVRGDFRALPFPDGSVDTVAYDPAYVCVSLDTEILTRRGWLRWVEVGPRDEALTVNRETGLAEWQVIEAVSTMRAGGRLVSIEGQAHSSLTTPAHRWPVRGKRRSFPLEWDTSERFRVDSVVPIAAELADPPVEPKYDDALVEVVAWFWTEGHIERNRDGEPGGYGHICQKFDETHRCDRIRSALRRLFGPPCEDGFPRVGRATDGTPRWRESRSEHKAVFHLSADAGRILQRHAPGRVPTFDFLLSLTRAQLDLFVEVSILADGHVKPSGARTLGQKNRAAAEAFQFAAILAGHATSIRSTPHPLGYEMWTVRLRSRRGVKPSRLGVTEVAVDESTMVWCPTVKNETWLARRNGTVYFTGNSPGGRKTSTLPDFNDRFGLLTTPKNPEENQAKMNAGLAECARVASRFVLVKCKDYVWSGRLFPGVWRTQSFAAYLGLELVDLFHHVGDPGPQPKNRTRADGAPVRQQHARQNLSVLLVFRVPRRRPGAVSSPQLTLEMEEPDGR